MSNLVLHEDPISGNCYKIKLTASLVSQPLERKIYNTLRKETRTPDFLNHVSPYGRIPVLQIGSDTFMPESNAACYYIAESAKSGSLVPGDVLLRAEMLRWMFFEQNQHEVNIATLRFWRKYIGVENLDPVQTAQLKDKAERGAEVLQCMDDHLRKTSSGWFVGDSASLADVALYAYTHVAAESGLDLNRYPSIVTWCRKVENLDGYISMEAEPKD